MKTIREVCIFIGAVLKNSNPVCVETGCTYTCAAGNEVHTTTNNLWEYICRPNKGRLWSFDINDEHISFAADMLDEEADVVFVQGDSVEGISKMISHGALKSPIDVLCLDSKEFDEDHMINEYNAAKSLLKEKHFVLVDDIHNPNSVKYKKMVPLLQSLDYSWVEIFTPTGLFLAAKGYSLPEK